MLMARKSKSSGLAILKLFLKSIMKPGIFRQLYLYCNNAKWMTMKIGDKVRVTKGKEEGFVTKIINEKLVEIEIEDGFRIPVLKNELSLVAAEETNYFERGEEEAKAPEVRPKGKAADIGFCLAFHEINDKALSIFIINNTNFTIPYCVYLQNDNKTYGKSAGHLLSNTSLKIDEFDRRNFENWPELIVQALFFSKKADQLHNALERRFKFKASTFFRNERIAPVILKKAYLFEIGTSTENVDLDQLSSKLQEGAIGRDLINDNSIVMDKPVSLVDLHIEKLSKDAASLSSSQILQIQLQAFEKALDLAIAGGLEEITFIHGVGNGILRDAIHKQLSKDSNIQFFKDALKEKFGYGATLVRIL